MSQLSYVLGRCSLTKTPAPLAPTHTCPNLQAKRESGEWLPTSSLTLPSFSSSNYAAARPRYTAELLDEITRYHGKSGVSAELGCGPGTITAYLSTHSDRVIATDPSPNMIAEAKKHLAGMDNIDLREAAAGDLPALLTQPVDLIVSGEWACST